MSDTELVEVESKGISAMEWFIYILLCENNSFYTGITKNLERRFCEHKNGKGGKYTSSHRPTAILYFETCATRSDALKREAQIKRWSRQKKENLIERSRRESDYTTIEPA